MSGAPSLRCTLTRKLARPGVDVAALRRGLLVPRTAASFSLAALPLATRSRCSRRLLSKSPRPVDTIFDDVVIAICGNDVDGYVGVAFREFL